MRKVKIPVYFTFIIFLLLLPKNAFSVNKNNSLVEINDIKYLSYSGHERIIVATSANATFSAHKLSNPERLYIDLKNATVGNGLERKIQTMNGLLKAVRIGQHDTKTVRVVFDFETREYEEKISIVKNPPQIVVDVFSSGPKKDKTEVVTQEENQRGKITTGNPSLGAESPPPGKNLKTERVEPSPKNADTESMPAGPSSIEAGLQAELEGRWEDAIEIYRSILAKEPERVNLWVRLGELEIYVGNFGAAKESLQKATQLSPDDHKIFFLLSKAYSGAGDPQRAFTSIEKAVELDPNSTEYLKTRATTSNWIGKSETAAESYKRILALSPEDETMLLYLARSQSWSGKLDAAVRNYRKYYNKHPEDKDVLIEHAEVEGWRGNYSAALSLLERYRRDAGETTDYQKEKARILAWAERPTAALELILPLLKKAPDDYELHFSHAIAQHYANRPREALRSLTILEKLRPLSKETDDIRRFLKTPLRSNIGFGLSFYTDSDDLDIYHSQLSGAYSLSPETFLKAGVENDFLHADTGSGLEQINGEQDIWHSRVWLGISHRLSPKVALDGQIGGSSAGSETKAPTYHVAFNFSLSDELKLKLERDYGFYVVSPRTLSLGITRGANSLQLYWTPTLDVMVDAIAGYDTLSDHNKRWELMLEPRRAFLRSAKFNLDIGITTLWFGFDKNLDNGYYSPDLYQSYMLTGFGYWKINDDNGVSIVLSLGVQKDETMDGFRFGGDATVEGTFGLYRDWMLVITGGITHNVRQAAGAFRAFSVGAALTRRF